MSLTIEGAPALKCGARDRWIGWDYGVHGRLHLVTNNSRFLILPGGERNLGSRVLSLCARRLVNDWPARFGHDLLLAETFVDPAYFRGTVYRAANWIEVGRTRGFARDGHSYSEHAHPKLVFLHPLCRGDLDPRLRHECPRYAERRTDAARVLPATIPAAARAGAMHCPRCWPWPPPRRSAACAATRRSANGSTISAPRCCSASACAAATANTARPACRRWQPAQGAARPCGRGTTHGRRQRAGDRKTLRGAIDAEGCQAHVLGIVGHDTKAPWGQKKSV